MTTSQQHVAGQDPETPESVLTRFAITTLQEDQAAATITAAMPIGGMVNPFTGEPTIAALAILVDDVGGRANYFRRGAGQWTVSSELTIDLSPDGIDRILADPDQQVVASSRPIGPLRATLLAICTLTHGDVTIGTGTVRTVVISGGPDGPVPRGRDPLNRSPQTSLADLMSVQPVPTTAEPYTLAQRADPIVNNLIGIVHGGVSSAGLELVASAAINAGQHDPLRTASLRVNFLRPLFAGEHSRYEGRAVRVGRNSAVGDALAIGDGGKTAIMARVTGYR